MNASDAFINQRGKSAAQKYHSGGGHMRADSNLKKVYGNMLDLGSLDESLDGNNGKKKRGMSGRPGGR
jgi:hypothetical protein